MKKRLAMTFAEIMIAIAIMMFAMLPIFGLMSSSNQATRGQKLEGVVANLAKEEMNRWVYVLDPSNFPPDDTEYFVNGAPFVIEGNEIEIRIRIYRHFDNVTKVTFPYFGWHDFRINCANGQEKTPLGTLEASIKPVTRNIAEIVKGTTASPAPAGDDWRLVDIVLEAKWRTPDMQWSDVNKLYLVSRRARL